jgi:hypothetical protein
MAGDDDDTAIVPKNYYQQIFKQNYQSTNPDQREFIDNAMHSAKVVNRERNGQAEHGSCVPRLFFLTGDGGTGKTYVYNVCSVHNEYNIL